LKLCNLIWHISPEFTGRKEEYHENSVNVSCMRTRIVTHDLPRQLNSQWQGFLLTRFSKSEIPYNNIMPKYMKSLNINLLEFDAIQSDKYFLAVGG